MNNFGYRVVLGFCYMHIIVHYVYSAITTSTSSSSDIVSTSMRDSQNTAQDTSETLSIDSRLYDQSLPIPFSSHELEHRTLNRRRLDALGTELTPLYPGYGTHFSYIYIGTPPQRQSVIIDTGSRLTAFPCTGCQQCGKHTAEKYFDWNNSSTAKVSDCKGKPCVISQSYSEGSSWRAFKLLDLVYVGAIQIDMINNAPQYAVEFTFGCQTYETGLFRTQLADGIMGLSMSEDTLPFVLFSKGITSTKMFALCFRVGGGIMTIGGVDQTIHAKPDINYAKLIKKTGWFTVNLLDIQMQDQNEANPPKSLGVDKSSWSGGKGCIVDSGTTDTYLPSNLAMKFRKLFREIAAIDYNNNNIHLSNEMLSRLPNIIFIFEGLDGNPFPVVMKWSSYLDIVGSGKYAFRIYLTEGQGMVLGANFMNNHNIIFDPDGQRIGFAKSSCKYEHYAGSNNKSNS